MKILTPFALVLSIGISMSLDGRSAQAQDADAFRHGEAALSFASGSIQKTTPRDGIVNLITGDNQASGNRMLLAKQDILYLKFDNPANVAVGDLFTVYKRVRKVFHPSTNEYLGFVVLRLAIVKVIDIGHALTTVEAMTSYGQISPGDPVMRFVAPLASGAGVSLANVADLSGMIIEIQADRPMTMVSQYNVIYLDRGSVDGLKAGDLMDIHRRGVGLPVRKVGQLKVLSTEERTATAQVIHATTRVLKGDRVKLVGYSDQVIQPMEMPAPSAKAEQAAAVPADLVAGKFKAQDASGQSRINLGDMANSLRYESGQAAIKPEGYKILDQLIEHLLTSGDTRLIRVEGHTDNVEIGPSLKSRYPNNLELSKARAGGVLRYLIEKGGLDSARLSSVGLGDSRPAATNANEEGRTKNRRVEIVLYEPTAEPQASTSDVQNQVQQQGNNPPRLDARESNSKLAAPPDASATPGSGTLSVGEQRAAAVGDGTGISNSPDTSGTGLSASQQRPQEPAGAGPTASNSPPTNIAPSQEPGRPQQDIPQSTGSPGL